MKYLKIFEEFNLVNILSQEDLRDFCEIHLAYLLDEQFILDVTDKEENPYHHSNNFIITLNSVKFFRWDVIKDHFIPFLVHLENEYGDNINTDIRIKTSIKMNYNWVNTTLENLINDNCKYDTYSWTDIEIEIYK
jgi:hypothetical protein